MSKCCNILILGIDLKESRKCDSDLIVQTKVILPCITLILKDNIFLDFKYLLKNNSKKEEKEDIILFEVNQESKEMKKLEQEKPSLM